MHRFRRIAGSFVIVLIAYWAYALLIVRWIEPSVQSAHGGPVPVSLPEGDLLGEQLKPLQKLFSSDAWELKNPKILESDRATLLLREYRNLGNGWVEITPCTIIFPYEGPADNEEQRLRQSIVLEVPSGALLQFDQSVDITRGKIGRLVSGQLRGKITIRSDWKEVGSEDDLRIVTEDIRLTDRTVTTVHPVDFRWGPHFGRGKDMVINLLAGPPKRGVQASGPNFSGVATFEIRTVERLHLDLAQTTAERKTPSEPVPVEISCRGPFLFDVGKKVATFRDRVDVTKRNPTGPSDQIACELLSLFFMDRAKQKTSEPVKKTAATNDSFNLTAERLEARGNPVVITAPSQQATARGPRVEYNLQTQSIALDGANDVFLRQGPHEIHARSLYYQAGEPGRLGRVMAAGPGWLRGQSPDRADQQLEAFWQGQLRVEPHENNQVIALTGGAELKFRGVGQLQASEIFFWLVETPSSAEGGASRLRPDRMLARNDVRMNSMQLSGKMDQMEVWFREERQGQESPPRREFGSAGQTSSTQPSLMSPGSLSPASVQQRFEVTGRLLRAQVLLNGGQPGISQLQLEDGAQFVETQTAQPGERPILIRGDRMEVTNATSPEATVTVLGRPARFEGRGLGLTGTNIHLHRGANRLWIDGPGQMDLPLSQGQQGPTPASSEILTVNWRERMAFDGETAKFEESIVAVAMQSQARTELQTKTLEVKMQRPLRFSESSMSSSPQVEHIRCLGGVLMENRTFDAQRQLTAYDRLQVTDVGVNLLNGELTAGGPGWINSVRRQSENTPSGENRIAPAAYSSSPANPSNSLMCLHVRFQRSISGNVLRRRLTFHEQVRSAYATVNDWEAFLATDNPDRLGPNGVTMRCEQLSVVEMPQPLGNQRAVELDALGNAVVEGTTFIARGNRVSYSQAKEMLILEGDGRNNAELFQQPQPGAPATSLPAQKIHYWLKTKQVKVIGAQSLQIGQFPSGAGQ